MQTNFDQPKHWQLAGLLLGLALGVSGCRTGSPLEVLGATTRSTKEHFSKKGADLYEGIQLEKSHLTEE